MKVGKKVLILALAFALIVSCFSSSNLLIPWKIDAAASFFYEFEGVYNGLEYGIVYYQAEKAYIEIYGCKNDIYGIVEIPSEIDGVPVKAIENGAFNYGSGITGFILPDNLEEIYRDSFEETEWYKNTDNWENGCLYCGDYLIAVSEGLNGKINIKNGTKVIVSHAFNENSGITRIVFPQGVNRILREACAGCSSLTSVDFPVSLTEIGEFAFCDCQMLDNVTIPFLVETIDFGVFSSCKSLKNLFLSEGVISIKENAFSNCEALEKAVIPDSVKSIDRYAFKDSGVNSLNLGSGLEYIDNRSFSGCSMISEINISANNPCYYSRQNCLIDKADKKLVLGCKGSSIPDDGVVTSIGKYAFYDASRLESVYIPVSITVIETYAFHNCSSLSKVTYQGSKAQWNSTVICSGNAPLLDCDLTCLGGEGAKPKYNVGDLITFGSYPQSRVSDTSLINNLNSQDIRWISYDYYIGQYETGATNHSPFDGTMYSSDYMQYADITYNGEEYRAVRMDAYRPSITGYKSPEPDDAYQRINGFECGEIYWFKYEPIVWRVLNPYTGLVMSESILDSQAYNNYVVFGSEAQQYYKDNEKTVIANDYEKSDIRQWLNSDFYFLAFNTEEQKNIETATIVNKIYSSSNVSSSYQNETNDRVYLLSSEEADNTNYGFNSYTDRRCKGSDYAKSQGLQVTDSSNGISGYSPWRYRTPDSVTRNSLSAGALKYSLIGPVFDTSLGIRPAIILKTVRSDAQGSQSEPETLSTAIRNYVETRNEAYKATITFYSGFNDIPAGSSVHWFVNGKDVAMGESYTVEKATSDYTIQSKLVYPDGSVIAESKIETVKINSGFFAKIIAFFRQIFGALPVITQAIKETL